VSLLEINSIYKSAMEFKGRYVNLYGGRSSGKSVFAGQKLITRTLYERKHLFLLVRKVHKTIKGSQLKLLKEYIYHYNLSGYFKFYENEIRCVNGNGFICAGLDDPEKLKSMQGITGFWIEEATELSEEDFRNVDAVMRGNLPNYKQGILTYNPINHLHWLNKVKLEDAITVRSTYKDNKFTDADYINMLESLKEKNPDLYKVWTMGEWGVKLDLIYVPFQKLDAFPETFDETIYGLDFGYNNPSVLIEINIKDGDYYLREKLYQTKLTNSDLISELEKLKIKSNAEIYCDSAEPQRIEELSRADYNAMPSNKSVKDGIDFLKAQKIYSSYDNEHLNDEVNTYCWKKNKDGNLIDEPIKFNDHCLDAARYAIYTHSLNKGNLPSIG